MTLCSNMHLYFSPLYTTQVVCVCFVRSHRSLSVPKRVSLQVTAGKRKEYAGRSSCLLRDHSTGSPCSLNVVYDNSRLSAKNNLHTAGEILVINRSLITGLSHSKSHCEIPAAFYRMTKHKNISQSHLINNGEYLTPNSSADLVSENFPRG